MKMIQVNQVERLQFEKTYLSLVRSFYMNNGVLNYYLNDIQNALQYSANNDFQKLHYFCVCSERNLLGCMALIEDHRLPEDLCFFGFFECKPEREIFDKLWKAVTNFARTINKVRIAGPVNGSIWHQYRVISRDYGLDMFPSEPLSLPEYSNLFMAANPEKQINYHSALRKDPDIIINLTKDSFYKVKEKGIHIERVTLPEPKIIRELYDISCNLFAGNWGYVKLDFDAFKALYNPDKVKNYIGSIYLAQKGSEIVGFCLNIEADNILIMKTIGVLPEYQQQGVGNALVHKIHFDAKEKGVKSIIYALINKENKIKHFPRNEVIEVREYAVFEYLL